MVATVEPLRTIQVKPPSRANASAFSSSTYSHVVTGAGRHVVFWDSHSGDEIASIRGTGLFKGVVELRDASSIAAWSYSPHGLVGMRVEGDELRVLYQVPHPAQLYGLTAVPGNGIVTGCGDGCVRSFMGEEKVVQWHAGSTVKHVHAMEDGHCIAYGSTDGAGIVDLRDTTSVMHLCPTSEMIVMSPSQHLAAAAWGCDVKLMDLRKPPTLLHKATLHSSVNSMELVTETALLTAHNRGVCCIRPVASLKEPVTLATNTGEDIAHATAVNGDGVAVVSAEGAGCVLFDLSGHVSHGGQDQASVAPTTRQNAAEHAVAEDDGDCEPRLPPGFED
eukprot:NODE_1906_length_1185_cov_51.808129_g1890_i0.p1 GENE.NODE_1906_length_1185_cov_51.808129_g1890_i0~~NODE_1906_length_1185_cov_51.808129_g1890_i0.p1  ORF type:complete len:334 (+),score=46.61 NODE_1906_length_1185_cov_51.808129_g1890_i0:67-1068(+)